jgi:hypothetical protein
VSALQQVHLRVNDAATGKPTPCRVSFTDSAGKYYAPHGRLTDFACSAGADVGGNLQQTRLDSQSVDRFAYIDGSCEIGLPPGLLQVTICKGPEYPRLEQQIQLAAGKLAWRYTLQRWSDVRQQQWFPGDCRCHLLSPHAALLEGTAEDLAVVNLLACLTTVQDDREGWSEPTAHPAFSNLLAFSGQEPALEQSGCMVVVNTHNIHHQLGSLGLLNCHRVVYPLAFGFAGHEDKFDNWTLADWCDQCHRKQGLVIWTWTTASDRKPHGEVLADLLLGKVDAYEVDRFSYSTPQLPWSSDNWYGLLNCGFQVPLVGASGKNCNYIALGAVRTYARLLPDQPLSYQHWIEAVRAGRTFASNGPLLSLEVDGRDPGATLALTEGRPVRVRASARSLVPFERLEVIVNGEVAANQTPSGHPAEATLETEIYVPPGGWLAARCWGRTWLPGYSFGQRVYAHTSPVYLRHAGRPPPIDAAAVRMFGGYLDASLQWVQTQGRFENDAQRERLVHVFQEALRVLQTKLSG